MNKKNLIGALVMAGMILLSLPLGAAHSAKALREDVEDEYYYDQTGYAIYEGLDARVAAAENLITVAERYEDADDGMEDAMERVEDYITMYENAYSWEEDHLERQVRANNGLSEAAEALSARLNALPITDRDAQAIREQLADMDSEQDKIQRSSYNDAARDYNEKLTHFPLSLFRGFLGIGDIPTFDGTP